MGMGLWSLLKWAISVELNDTTVIMEALRHRRPAREYILLIAPESLGVLIQPTRPASTPVPSPIPGAFWGIHF
jgi:hypothetical protein